MSNKKYCLKLLYVCSLGLSLVFLFVSFGCKKLDLSQSSYKTDFGSSVDQKKSSSGTTTDSSVDDSKTSSSSSSSSSDDDDDDEDVFNPITSKYNMQVVWNESSYGKWSKVSDFTIRVEEELVLVESLKKSLTHLAAGSIQNGEVESRMKASVSSKEEMEYIRTSGTALTKKAKKDSNYDRGSYAFIFVDSVSTSSDSGTKYIYEFSSPIPFVPRSDLTMSNYKKFANQSFEYTYTTYDSVLKREISFKNTCMFTVEAANKVSVVINNEISSNLDSKKRADVYGRFPMLKQTTYTINTTKKRISTLSGSGAILISKETGNSRFDQGNIAKVVMDAKLCSYKVEGSSATSYSCQL